MLISICRARATNTQLGQEENSQYTRLEVNTSERLDVSPEIIIPPSNVTVTRHQSVTELQCIANARPLHMLNLVWLKDGVPIEQSGIPYSFNDLWNRTLSLISVDFVHDGVYTCSVQMRTGGPTLSQSARVTVTGTVQHREYARVSHSYARRALSCQQIIAAHEARPDPSERAD